VAKRRFDWTRLGISVAAVAAVALIVLGFRAAETANPSPTLSDPAVRSVVPEPGSLVLGQQQVGVYLAPGYRGVLLVDGQELPTSDVVAVNPAAGATAPTNDDAQFDPGTGSLLFTPRPGAAIEQLSPGEHTVTAVFWPVDQSRSTARNYSWQFKVS
jgi:hypothetical protein